MSSRAIAVLTLLLLPTPVPADAQPAFAAWAEGRLLVERDASLSDTAFVGMVSGGAVGVDWSRFGLRFEADWPLSHEASVVEVFTDLYGLQHRVVGTYRRSSPGWFAVAAVTPWRSQRVAVSVVAGWAGITHRYRAQRWVTETFAPDGRVLTSEEVATPDRDYWWPGLVVGADVAVPLRRAALVLETRAIAFPLADAPRAILRAGVATRFSF